ncbi:hypothetical protein NKG94_50480 [Micromonospora sp. M12]
MLLLLPGVLFLIAFFIYPFLYGLNLSLHPCPSTAPVSWPTTSTFSPTRTSAPPSGSRSRSGCLLR